MKQTNLPHHALTLFSDELAFAEHKFQISLLICCE